MNIFLTGGSGFVGRNIKENLSNQYAVFAPKSDDLDLTDHRETYEYIKQNKITHIIHCATINQKRRNENTDEVSANLDMFYSLANCTDMVEKIIYFGSGAEFDKSRDIISAKEEDIPLHTPSFNNYSTSKYKINQLKNSYDNIYNLRLFGVYGKYENRDTCFPSHLCNCVLKKEKITIRKDCIFDFLYIDDLFAPLQYILEHTPKYKEYNICSGEKVKLSQMAEWINETSNTHLPIEFLNAGLAFEYTGDNSRINNELDLQYTKVKTGLQRLYHYYKSKESQ